MGIFSILLIVLFFTDNRINFHQIIVAAGLVDGLENSQTYVDDFLLFCIYCIYYGIIATYYSGVWIYGTTLKNSNFAFFFLNEKQI